CDALELLALTPAQRDFVWACVVATTDPVVFPHVVILGGSDARRGLSPAVYAALTGADDADSIALAHWLAGDPPIVRLGLRASELDGAARALCAEAVLRGAVPVIADVDRVAGAEPPEIYALLARVLDDVPGACAITTSGPGLELPVARGTHRVSWQIADVA